jgi:hypothetical protein
MMNILVVGGATPGKFGNDFVNQARSQGHRVLVIAHADPGYHDSDLQVANFNQVSSVTEAFGKLTADVDNIGIMLYNSNKPSYPRRPQDYSSQGTVDEQEYFSSLMLHAVIPHALGIECQKKMSAGGKLVFMSSWSALDFKNNLGTDNVGYTGGKAFQTRLMTAFAHHNDRGLLCSAIYPHFDYANPEHYTKVANKVYEFIITFGREHHGKIVGISNPDRLNVLN